MNKELFAFIENSPTAFHTVDTIKDFLLKDDFIPLNIGEEWNIEEGKGYFVTRNNSSLISFKVPCGGFKGFMIGASHSDSPCFKLKSNPVTDDGMYVRLNTERYGGMINSTWLDRPLSLAGRVIVSTPDGIRTELVNSKKPVAIIPNIAIHLNKTANEGTTYNAAVDLVPLYSTTEDSSFTPSFMEYVADLLYVSQDDILASDLFLYNADKGYS